MICLKEDDLKRKSFCFVSFCSFRYAILDILIFIIEFGEACLVKLDFKFKES